MFKKMMIAAAVLAASALALPGTAHAEPAQYLQTGLSPYLVLDAHPDTVHQNGGKVHKWTLQQTVQQKWEVRLDGTIRPVTDTTMCLDANPNQNYNGGTVYLWGCNGTAQQKWLRNGLTFQNDFSKRCLDADPTTNYSGGRVYQWACNGTVQQNWFRINP